MPEYNLHDLVNSELNINSEVESISRIPIIPKLLEVICSSTGMRFAAVARVTENKWIACGVRDEISFGLVPGDELKVETTLCNDIRKHQKAVVIDHVDEDETYYHHPTPEMYGFQSYISMPIIRKNGDFFGTLCALDPKPAQLKNSEVIGMFELFAELISFHLETVDQLAFSESRLLKEVKTSALREQFIAILGHDLRNPVNAVSNSAQLMLQLPLDEPVKRLATIIKNSSYRISGLIENIMDFAQGRLGGGIILKLKANESLEAILEEVVTEIRAVWTDRAIEVKFDIGGSVYCDGGCIAQVFSNLLSNALTYGKKDEPIRIRAVSKAGEFLLSVSNTGNKIPDIVMDRLFQPFSRGEIIPGQKGLGLGLYIASEIARAHGGKLEVISTTDETRFTLRMPSEQPST